MDERIITVTTYLALALLWGTLLVIYLRHYKTASRRDPLVASLLAVLALDALKNLVESVYFGLLWGSRYEVLPRGWGEPLESPLVMPLPKLFNIAVAIILLLRVAGRVIPDELRDREARREEQERLRIIQQETLAQVQASERRLQSLFEATSDLVSVWVPTSDGSRFELESLNPAASAFFQVDLGSADAARSNDASALFGEDFATLLADAATARRPVRHDSATTSTPNGPRQLNTQLIPFVDDHGVVVRVAALSHDITELTARAQEEDQRTRLESLGLLAGGVAHDFNNLLAVVKADVDLARAGTRAADGSSGSDDVLAHAGDAIARARELVEQLMSTAGARARQSEPVDVVAVVDDTVRLLSPGAGEVKLRVEGARPVDAFVHGDRAQLQQIVLNLLQNGVEALAGEGTVTAQVTVADADVVITVSDDGRGISPGVQARMFDPFFTTKVEGRGLGLSTVFGLARAHGGSVEVHSEPADSPRHGARFAVHLPRCPPSLATAPAGTSALPAVAARLRVLLVDDDDRVRRATRRLLERLGHTVQDVASGVLALEVDDAYDLVVIDVTMPDLDGPQTLGRLRETRPRLPAVVITGRGGIVVKEDVVLAKPFDFDRLQAAIEGALDRQRRVLSA